MSIPAFVNPGAGTAAPVLEALRRDPAFAPELLDGIEIVPAGTLNHFARDHGIPTDPGEAVRLAATGAARPVDVGYVNDRLFINTSSVGAYVRFVRARDRAERVVGYRAASLVAGLVVLLELRRIRVSLEVAGERRIYRAPLLMVGVGERSLAPPELGGRVAGGARALDVIVPRGFHRARRLLGAYTGSGRGLRSATSEAGVDRLLVDRCRVELTGRRVRVAVDGEITTLAPPLEYRLARDRLRVVTDKAVNGER